MAVGDTYNGDLVKIKQNCPEAGGDFDVQLTAFQEEATAYIDLQVAAAGATGAITADDMLKAIEAKIGGGLFKEASVFPADAKEFSKVAQHRMTGEKWLETWIDTHHGPGTTSSDIKFSHQKSVRLAHPASSKAEELLEVIDVD